MEEKTTLEYKIDERDIFIKGNLIDLKVLNENDVINTNWYGWFNDEETTNNMQKHCFPNTLDKQMEFLNNLKNDKSKIQLGIICKENNQLIGCVSLQNIDYINRTAEIAEIIGEKQYRTIRYMEESIGIIIKFGFNTLNLNRIYGGTLSEEFALFLIKRFKFKKEGLFRNHVFKNGEYKDIYYLGLLYSDFNN